MKEWTILVSQNGWEYTGIVTIKANKVELKRGNDADDEKLKVIIADGIEIEFDEEIALKERGEGS